MLIEEEWFDDTDLADGATFPMAMIKREKYIFNNNYKIHVTQHKAYRKFQYTMVVTHRLPRYFMRNVMQFSFSK